MGHLFQTTRSTLFLGVILALSGCASGGFSLQKAEVDRSLYTGGIPAGAKSAGTSDLVSDEATIRNAVTSADVQSLQGKTVLWANADTGSRGAIDNIVEVSQTGVVCRRFSTTRESFDGVALFRGETCMVSAGAWRLQLVEVGKG